VENASDTAVTWTLSSTVDGDKGTIDSAGLYTAVDMDTLSENKVSVTVTAISGEDSTKSSSLTFTVEKTYYMVADINSSGDSSPSYLAVYDGKLYFQADDGTNGTELWVYND
jgi:hypothetical protein